MKGRQQAGSYSGHYIDLTILFVLYVEALKLHVEYGGKCVHSNCHSKA